MTEKASYLSAYGPVALIMAATPVLIAGYALWANRRPDRSRLLTFALIAMALASLLTGGITIFLPTLLALGVGTFRIRKADMEAGMAAAPAPAAGGRGDVIDADVTDAPAAPKTLLQRLLGPGLAAGGARGARASRGRAGDEDVIDADVVDDDARPTPRPTLRPTRIRSPSSRPSWPPRRRATRARDRTRPGATTPPRETAGRGAGGDGRRACARRSDTGPGRRLGAGPGRLVPRELPARGRGARRHRRGAEHRRRQRRDRGPGIARRGRTRCSVGHRSGPPAAQVTHLTLEDLPPREESGFRVTR